MQKKAKEDASHGVSYESHISPDSKKPQPGSVTLRKKWRYIRGVQHLIVYMHECYIFSYDLV